MGATWSIVSVPDGVCLRVRGEIDLASETLLVERGVLTESEETSATLLDVAGLTDDLVLDDDTPDQDITEGRAAG